VVRTFSGPTGTTIVCPALFPPAHLAQMSTSADKISTNFPFPSSPHCDPRTTVTEKGVRIESLSVFDGTHRSFSELTFERRFKLGRC